MNRIIKRVGLFLSLIAQSYAAKAPPTPLPEISMGRADAPVVMIEYSSLSCSHCADFHLEVLPKIQEKYVKPGHLRIIFRGFPGDQSSLKAQQLAWCQGSIKYLEFVKLLFSNQEKWLLADDSEKALKALALQNGMTEKMFEECLKNQERMSAIVDIRLKGRQAYNVTATPTIIINAKVYQKALSLKEIEEIIDPLLKSKQQQSKEAIQAPGKTPQKTQPRKNAPGNQPPKPPTGKALPIDKKSAPKSAPKS